MCTNKADIQRANRIHTELYELPGQEHVVSSQFSLRLCTGWLVHYGLLTMGRTQTDHNISLQVLVSAVCNPKTRRVLHPQSTSQLLSLSALPPLLAGLPLPPLPAASAAAG
jgi:hypothetical protein